ncbi:hypothetical protein GCM10022419_105300 [Nonomuraea rosea]|uniref:Uncharacterized protein n=1 Tax=Nonomuraea rosea TaxID=638574 RepID=A0ABP6ZEK5_9ACTN
MRELAAEHGDNLHVVDFAELGALPPQARKAGHQLAAATAAMELVTSFHEIGTYHLAATIAAAYEQAGGADDGGLDLDLDGAAAATAADSDLIELWEAAQTGARRDLVASLAQLLALTRRRRDLDADDVAAMIGKHAGPGRLWMLAERQLDDAAAAGRDWEREPMLPDAPHLPALATTSGSAGRCCCQRRRGRGDRPGRTSPARPGRPRGGRADVRHRVPRGHPRHHRRRPVQNTGAYGQQIADTLTAVTAHDWRSGHIVRLPAAACGFGYRTSILKTQPGRWTILAITLRLTRSRSAAPVPSAAGSASSTPATTALAAAVIRPGRVRGRRLRGWSRRDARCRRCPPYRRRPGP